MSKQPRRNLRRVATAVTLGVAGFLIATNVGTSSANGAQSLQADVPRNDTPIAVDGRAYAGTQVGDHILVGGDFTQVEPKSGQTAIAQPYFYSYDVTTGDLDPHQFDLEDRVSVAIPAAETGNAFIGGTFTSIDGVTRHKLAKIDLDAASVDATFVANTDGHVKDLALVGNTLYLTGGFTSVNGESRAGLAAVDATTGQVQADFDFPLTTYIGQVSGTIGQRIAATPDGNTLIVMHRAKFVAGQERRGVAMIDISATPTLSPWQTNFWNATSVTSIVDGEVSPDGSYFVVVGGWGDSPPWRDTAIAFPVAGGAGTDTLWVTRNHDSTFAVGIDDNAVYIGGHFCWTEGPTTPEPWQTLGPQGKCPNKTRRDPTNVYRDTFAALDPTTGKAIKYAPDTDARNGVRTIEIVPAGMLVGGDQSWTADVHTGRSALFDISTARENLALSGSATQSSTTNDAPAERAIDGNRDKKFFTQTITHTANDLNAWWEVDLGATEPVSTIEIWGRTDCCTDRLSDVWLFTSAQPFASTDPNVLANDPDVDAQFFTGELNRQTIASIWADVRYVRVQLDGTNHLSLSEVQVYANDQGAPDVVPPSLTFDSPLEGADEIAPVTLSGTASDDQELASVNVQVRNRDTNEWLRADGTWGAWTMLEGTLANPGAMTSAWSFDITSAPPGRYATWAQAVDAAGNTHTLVQVKFDIVLADAADPEVTSTTPAAAGETLAGPAITLAGTASDDVSVTEVRVAVRDRDTGTWLQADGTFGAWQEHGAALDAAGTPNTGWTHGVSLADGSYRLLATAYDHVGNTSTQLVVNFEVGALDVADPTVSQASPAVDEDVLGPALTVSGSAADDVAVAAVNVAVRDRDTDMWLQLDGTWAAAWVQHPATLATPGTATSDWSLDLTLDPGSYRTVAVATDAAAKTSAQLVTNFTVSIDDPVAPTGTTTSPAVDEVVAAGVVAMTGTADDNVAVASVAVSVRDRVSKDWLRSDGTFGSWEEHAATVAAPGTPNTTWDFSADLPAGLYRLLVTVTDTNGNQSTQVITNFEAQ